MRKQISSFRCAFRGIWNTVKSESHMRFHMVVGAYVLIFSLFYDFSPAQIALLIFLIASVMAAEIINTCIEELCNLTADRYEPLVKTAKDAAAGAVLVLSIAAVAVAVVFFFDIEVIIGIFKFFIANPVLIAVLVISAVVSILFIWLGPVGLKEKLLRWKLKNKKQRDVASKSSR
ncbi:MAG: diacylglycerol kinase family protein [Ruminococcus sp.]|nr:diacylglycerol kinase family protein [Ruminococcus sp.]